MLLVMQIFAALGIGMVLWACIEIFKPQAKSSKKKITAESPLAPKETEDGQSKQKIQSLQHRIAELEDKLKKEEAEFSKGKVDVSVAKENEVKFTDEIKRREDWVAKAESQTAKIRAENSELSNKFIAKEKELADEFAKGVNLSRELRESKSALEAKDAACRLKEDQIQAAQHQIEALGEKIKEQGILISGFKQKEKISEWVPKEEFNKLNQEYSEMEKELEQAQERIKSFAEEIAHLRKAAKPAEEQNKALPAGEDKGKEGEETV